MITAFGEDKVQRLFFFAILMLGGCSNPTQNAQDAVAYNLLDPDSAKFREVRTTDTGAVCGQINGKNRMGAYVGFKNFVAVKIGDEWFSTIVDLNNDVMGAIHQQRYLEACDPEGLEHFLKGEAVAREVERQVQETADAIEAEINAEYGFPDDEPVDIMETTAPEPTDEQIRQIEEASSPDE
ncbi:hypothetical protein K3172_15350 [Qipengyuania sp. 6B39]|uniref:hypothetical protein n=1 Tax=Qipengyuania proteolytica TaxID=2867239 RepID=UPI001C89B0BF|nr:hypothetical protein [Qipengyuania proteolytica]MBX7497235.1 hypothetical protein [Qipengyuania proteolytica]